MVRRAIIGIILLLAQVTLFKDIILFNLAFCFPYILILFVLPINTNRIALQGAGFLVGLLIDSFYNTPGLHAAACVLIMFLRPFWLNILLSGSNYDAGSRVSIRSMGFRWFATYLIPLTLIHHLILFFIEAGGFNLAGITLVKVLYSTLFSFTCMVIMQYIFASESRAQ